MNAIMLEHPYSSLIETLLISRNSPQGIMEMLAALSAIDYLDWEGLLEERQAALRVDRVFIRCSRCGVISNHEAWKRIKGMHTSVYYYCRDCYVELSTEENMFHCAWCQLPYLSFRPQVPDMDVCLRSKCDEQFKFVGGHLSRARVLGRVATLTVVQWKNTLAHFGQMCIYCGGIYQCLDHYLPLSLGGGTTAANCFPACTRCNTRKKDKHPDQFASLFPVENMTRIREYLNTVSLSMAS